MRDRIDLVNRLYEKGNTIIIETARGNVSGIDWYNATKKQLESWGCKFNDLSTGSKGKYIKPACDLVIDDKSKRIEEL